MEAAALVAAAADAEEARARAAARRREEESGAAAAAALHAAEVAGVTPAGSADSYQQRGELVAAGTTSQYTWGEDGRSACTAIALVSSLALLRRRKAFGAATLGLVDGPSSRTNQELVDGAQLHIQPGASPNQPVPSLYPSPHQTHPSACASAPGPP